MRMSLIAFRHLQCRRNADIIWRMRTMSPRMPSLCRSASL
jgi:hypothetical protein